MMKFHFAVLSCFGSIALANNTWVVILTSSRYWFNYRHAANGVLFYKLVKSLGIRDDHILLFNSLDISNDRKNPDPGYVHYSMNGYEERWEFVDMEVDFTQDEVSSSNFLRLMTGRTSNSHPSLNTDSNSSILLYMAGHGGDEFFKFHDHEELSAQDMAHMFREMYLKRRYKELLVILDTCQASTMANYITSPGIITLASSARGENSYAYPTSDALGVAIVDRFTHSLYSVFQRHMKHNPTAGYAQLKPKWSLYDLYASFQPHILHSTATLVVSPGSRNPREIMIADYFATPKTEDNDIDAITILSSPFSVVKEKRIAFVENLLFEPDS